MSIYLADVVNRFALPVPSPGWLQAIADYDGELRIFPSQKLPVFRLARVASKSGGYSKRLFAKLPGLNPDTKVMLERGLVAVTTIPKEAALVPPFNIVEQLRRRDLWRAGGGSDDASVERVADQLDEDDNAKEAATDARIQQGVRDRVRPMRTGYLYRTGARVSLVRPTIAAGPNAPNTASGDGGTAPAQGA